MVTIERNEWQLVKIDIIKRRRYDKTSAAATYTGLYTYEPPDQYKRRYSPLTLLQYSRPTLTFILQCYTVLSYTTTRVTLITLKKGNKITPKGPNPPIITLTLTITGWKGLANFLLGDLQYKMTETWKETLEGNPVVKLWEKVTLFWGFYMQEVGGGFDVTLGFIGLFDLCNITVTGIKKKGGYCITRA